MAAAPLLLFSFLIILGHEVHPSHPASVKSALTANLECHSVPDIQITVKVVAQNEETTQVNIQTAQGKTNYEAELPTTGDLGESTAFKYQFEQSALKEVTLTSSSDYICVNALVVNTAVVVDQPTDFKTICPTDTDSVIPDRPCKLLGTPIDMSSLFICPQRVKDLLTKKSMISETPRTEPKRGEPPVYDITGDMAGASLAIATGIVEFGGAITEARQNYRAGKNVKPFQKLSKLGSTLETAASFISTLGPVFGIFGGLASILTTFLTPNPFDELAKYLDDQFKQVNDQLFYIQADIADLGRLIEAKSGVLGVTAQIRALRYSTRKYGIMMNALSTRPVCGDKESFEMKEVAEFMRQYEADDVDNCLLDLYGVEFGELAETTSLLRPYMVAYCHNKPHLVQKLVDELLYYAYAGLQSHFTYYSLKASYKGGEFKIDNAWLEKLYTFAKKVSVFKEALKRPMTDTVQTNALQIDLEEEILIHVKRDERTIINWLKRRIIGENDWPYRCLMKDANGEDKRASLLILYFKVTSLTRYVNAIISPSRAPEDVTISSRNIYFRALRETPVKQSFTDPCDRKRHNVIYVLYCPDVSTCGIGKPIVVAWIKAIICVLQRHPNNPANEIGVTRHSVYLPKEWLDSADRF
ncbi:uncharacterized protein LOC114526931 [Dendronephthya gigantea]|uniref:uncharacterized protein LOC114526931 n=1 Tax=Dendronephthya gigantea TaxID=151771 RepID=UPI00106AC1BD|nr:uncharacterized protein LOC114526931 [Dendronephthya gigantea]